MTLRRGKNNKKNQCERKKNGFSYICERNTLIILLPTFPVRFRESLFPLVIYWFVKMATNHLNSVWKRYIYLSPKASSRKSPRGELLVTVIARSNIAPARRYLRPTTSLETFIQCVRNSLVRRVLFSESVELDARWCRVLPNQSSILPPPNASCCCLRLRASCSARPRVYSISSNRATRLSLAIAALNVIAFFTLAVRPDSTRENRACDPFRM